MIRAFFVLSFVSLVFIESAACSRSQGSAIRIAIGGQNQLVYLPTTLAGELGFYREEGLNVELHDFAGGSKALESLMGGSADVVSGFYDHTIQMAAEGRPLTAFVSMLRFPGLILVTSPQNGSVLTRIEDLKGRVLGVTSVGASSHMLLTYLLKRHGIAPEAVSVTPIGTAATAIAAMEHGKVDAGIMTDPAFTVATRRNPGIRVLADLRHAEGVNEAFGTTAYPASVLYAQTGWLRDHVDNARRLAHAIQKTLTWMHSHTPEEIASKTPAFGGEDQTLYVEALRNSMPMYSLDGVMPPDGAEAVHKLLMQSLDKVRTAKIDLSSTYTNEFVR